MDTFLECWNGHLHTHSEYVSMCLRELLSSERLVSLLRITGRSPKGIVFRFACLRSCSFKFHSYSGNVEYAAVARIFVCEPYMGSHTGTGVKQKKKEEIAGTFLRQMRNFKTQKARSIYSYMKRKKKYICNSIEWVIRLVRSTCVVLVVRSQEATMCPVNVSRTILSSYFLWASFNTSPSMYCIIPYVSIFQPACMRSKVNGAHVPRMLLGIWRCFLCLLRTNMCEC